MNRFLSNKTATRERCWPKWMFLVTCGVLVASAWPALRLMAQDENEAKKEAEQKAEEEAAREALNEIRRRVESAKIVDKAENDVAECVLWPEPLILFSDEPRKILHGSLWVWQSHGRPVVLMKVEHHRGGQWTHAVASVSAGLIDIQWESGRQFTAKKPGITLQPLAGAPVPDADQTKRRKQMLKLTARFSGTLEFFGTRKTHALRFSPRALHNYSDPEGGLKEGAIFGLTSHGATPDAFIFLEVHQEGDDEPTWRYGVAAMTADRMDVKLDGEQILAKQFSALGFHDTWGWFLTRD